MKNYFKKVQNVKSVIPDGKPQNGKRRERAFRRFLSLCERFVRKIRPQNRGEMRGNRECPPTQRYERVSEKEEKKRNETE